MMKRILTLGLILTITQAESAQEQSWFKENKQVIGIGVGGVLGATMGKLAGGWVTSILLGIAGGFAGGFIASKLDLESKSASVESGTAFTAPPSATVAGYFPVTAIAPSDNGTTALGSTSTKV